jgi:hypothetical protein
VRVGGLLTSLPSIYTGVDGQLRSLLRSSWLG